MERWCKVAITTLYEDNHILVVIKPPEIPVQEDASGALDLLTILKDYLKEKYNKPGNVFLGLVHRLDRNAGGVMVFAKTSKAAARLSTQIRERETKKTYLAVVSGCPEKSSSRLIDFLYKNEDTNTVSVVEAGTSNAKEAILDYETIDQVNNVSLIRVSLLTGRAHQIRVQMAHNGTPVYGDTKYGFKREQPGYDLALWSYKMEIDHPIKKERMCFTAPPPDTHPWNLFKRLG